MRRLTLGAAALLTLTACGTQGSSAPVTSTVVVTATPGAQAPTTSAATSTSPSAVTSSAATSSAAAARGRDATQADLLGATVPATCRMPAQKLVGGHPTQLSTDEGRGEGEIQTQPAPVLVDLDGDGTKEIVGLYLCNAGGVSWPQQVLAVWAGGRTVAYDLSRDQEHTDVVRMVPGTRAVELDFGSYEGAGMDVHRYTGRLTADGGTLRWSDTVAPRALSDSEAQAYFDSRTATPQAPTAAAAAGGATQVSSASFLSPSGRLACVLGDEGASCEIGNPTYAQPAKPADCDGAYGDSLTVSPGQAAAFRCHGDTIFGTDWSSVGSQPWWSSERDGRATSVHGGPAGPALAYGHRLRSGSIECVIDHDSGATCRTDDGHGFSLAGQAYKTW